MSKKKKEETKPDRPASPLPSITAPKFQPAPGTAAPEVSITSPNTAPNIEEPEERTNTETLLDPNAYAPPADKNPDELSSDFQPVSGKQLDAGGRLVAQKPVEDPITVQDAETDTAVPKLLKQRPFRRPEPKASEPPVQQVGGQRSEPGRWILNREGQVSPESISDVEPGAFDPTVLRAAPSGPPKKLRPPIIGVAAAVVVLVAGAAVWWVLRPASAQEADEEVATPGSGETSSDPEPARLRITSRPSGAVVHINGVSLGVTPVDRASPFAPEAELEVEVLLKGYRPWTRRFHAGQSVSTHAQLKPAR